MEPVPGISQHGGVKRTPRGWQNGNPEPDVGRGGGVPPGPRFFF